MELFRRLGLYLNDEPGDEEALAFTGYLAELTGAEVHCVHVRGLEHSQHGPVPDGRELRHQVVGQLPPRAGATATIDVSTSTGIQEVLRTARELDLDLIVLGRHLPHEQMGTGSVFYRLARKAPCSVLAVPTFSHPSLSRLLVLVDDSNQSKSALQTAIALARATGDTRAQVIGQLVYSVGYGYRYTGRSFPDAVREWEEARRKRMEVFLADVDTSGVQFEMVYTCSEHTPEAVLDLAAVRNVDVVVVGGQCATAPAAALLGAIPERLLEIAPLPVLVVKCKGETTRFLHAFLDNA